MSALGGKLTVGWAWLSLPEIAKSYRLEKANGRPVKSVMAEEKGVPATDFLGGQSQQGRIVLGHPSLVPIWVHFRQSHSESVDCQLHQCRMLLVSHISQPHRPAGKRNGPAKGNTRGHVQVRIHSAANAER